MCFFLAVLECIFRSILRLKRTAYALAAPYAHFDLDNNEVCRLLSLEIRAIYSSAVLQYLTLRPQSYSRVQARAPNRKGNRQYKRRNNHMGTPNLHRTTLHRSR
ncbi:hypothetical protein B5807_02062 [Epicoccum nigrum]|uniref:Uncharacterized protein n=1 Tax=Epicoccum nigrum TaxID=105696 RepID=A0A1Y2MC50_EPING|nr:hypothetical protein B5807_02062 [Epicoccum nigrum]